jgi:hypothetical protein
MLEKEVPFDVYRYTVVPFVVDLLSTVNKPLRKYNRDAWDEVDISFMTKE